MPGTIATSITGPFYLNAVTNPLTVTNTGTVTSTDAVKGAIYGFSGTFDVTNHGTIQSTNNFGVSVNGQATIVSDGVITGSGGLVHLAGGPNATGGGIALLGGGSVSNSGSIDGKGAIGGGGFVGSGIFMTGAVGTVRNSGTITGQAYGVALDAGGMVTNTKSIIGGEDGVRFQGAVGTVINSGSIIGTVDDGIGFGAGGGVTNAAGASIFGIKGGIFVNGGVGTITNSGAISTNGFAGVDLFAGGTVLNNAGASITGHRGVIVYAASADVTNSGSIGGTSDFGVGLLAGGQVNNAAGASISGGLFGVAIYNAAATVTNNGTISGTSHAVDFNLTGALGFSPANGDNRLVVGSTGVFLGDVVGSTGTVSTNTLEFAAGSFTLNDLNGSGTVTENAHTWSFSNFGTVDVDAGATWTLSSDSNLAAIFNAGTMTVAAGALTSTFIQLDGGTLIDAGGLSLGAGTTLAGNGIVKADLSGAGTITANAGTLGLTNIGTGLAFNINPGAILRVDGSVGSGNVFNFGTSGEFVYNHSGGIVATIAGLNVGATNFVDYSDHVVTLSGSNAYTGTSGTVQLSDGSILTLTGVIASSTWFVDIKSDGATGSEILLSNTDPTPPIPTPTPTSTPVPTPDPTPAPTPATESGHFAIIDTSKNGLKLFDDSTAYSGPVAGIQWQFINTGADSLAVTATSPNAFIHTGSGTDAIDVSKVNGTNVLDGSTGSNFLVGGTGFDTFFVDDRGPAADVFSTVVGFHAGDNATIFGVTLTDFKLNTLDNLGAVGFKGLDFGFSAAGKANANLVLTGYTTADLTNGRLTTSFGTNAATAGAPASTFMLIHAN